MGLLTGRVGTGLAGARIPVRVEDPDTGAVVAATVTDPDGSFAVELDRAGLVRVAPRGVAPYDAYIGPEMAAAASAAVPAGEPVPGSPGDSPRARARRGAS